MFDSLFFSGFLKNGLNYLLIQETMNLQLKIWSLLDMD